MGFTFIGGLPGPPKDPIVFSVVPLVVGVLWQKKKSGVLWGSRLLGVTPTAVAKHFLLAERRVGPLEAPRSRFLLASLEASRACVTQRGRAGVVVLLVRGGWF